MRRRSGFTLVEVLVAMALTLFIMSILSAAFVAATQSFSDLKAAGDLAEKLRGAKNVLMRDLEADHIYDANGNTLRLSTLWQGTPNQPPPASGFFRIYQGTPDVSEGTDLDTIASYYQTQAYLHYTIGLNGNKRSDFLSATIPANSPLISGANPVYQFPDNYYQDTTGNFNSQTAEVAVFLVATGDQTDGTNGTAQPLFALYRRQFLPVPSGWPPPSPPAPAPITVPVPASPSPYLEMSTVPTAGEPSAATNLTFNTLNDLAKPVRRFWMNRGAPQGAFQSGTTYATMGQVNQSYQASDLLLSDVVSFDVRVLLAGDTEFRELYHPLVQQFSSGNPMFYSATNPSFPAVFDTWTNHDDTTNNITTTYSTEWNKPWQTPPLPATAATIPLYQTQPTGANPPPVQAISIQAIQIVLRVWDFKTKKTRQVTMVQQM